MTDPGHPRDSRAAPLDVGSVLPLYHRVYVALRQRLVEGRQPADRPLPGEPQLARQFGVSRVTIRRALKQLEAERLVVRRPARGTFAVPQPPGAAAPANISGWYENLVSLGHGTTAELLAFEMVAPPPDVARWLGEAAGPVLKIERLRRSAAGQPIAHYRHFLPPLTAGVPVRSGLGARPVISILEAAGFVPATAEQVLTARNADAAIAGWLAVPVGSALIALRRTYRDGQGRVIEFHESLYRPDRFEYRLTLGRGPGSTAPAWAPVDG